MRQLYRIIVVVLGLAALAAYSAFAQQDADKAESPHLGSKKQIESLKDISTTIGLFMELRGCNHVKRKAMWDLVAARLRAKGFTVIPHKDAEAVNLPVFRCFGHFSALNWRRKESHWVISLRSELRQVVTVSNPARTVLYADTWRSPHGLALKPTRDVVKEVRKGLLGQADLFVAAYEKARSAKKDSAKTAPGRTGGE